MPQLFTVSNIYISSRDNPRLACVAIDTGTVNVDMQPCDYPNNANCSICQDDIDGCEIISTGVCPALLSELPTNIPSGSPTTVPTVVPTFIPTQYATRPPTMMPTIEPTTTQTDSPTTIPSTQAPTPSTVINQPDQMIPSVINGSLQVLPDSIAKLSNVTVSGSVVIGANVTAVFVVVEKPLGPIIVQLVTADSITGQFSAYHASIPNLASCETVVYQPQQSATTLAVGISIDDSACATGFPVWGYALVGLLGAFLVAGIFGAILIWRRRRYIAQVKKDFQAVREQQLAEDMEQLKRQAK